MRANKAIAENLWEVWIDLQVYNENCCGTLYVVGDVSEEPEMKNFTLVKKREHIGNKNELHLELTQPDSDGCGKIKELHYSEEIENIEQYDSVCIFYNNEEIERFDQIEKLM